MDYIDKKNQIRSVYSLIISLLYRNAGRDEEIPKFWIAGGAITAAYSDYDINDFDIYSDEPERIISAFKNVYIPDRETENYANFTSEGYNIQVIRNYAVSSVEELFDRFDFTCCCGAYDGTTFIFKDSFLQDVDNKVIKINHMHMPIYTMKRLIKYASRGFEVDNVVITKVAKAINDMNVEWDNYNIEDEKYCKNTFVLFRSE